MAGAPVRDAEPELSGVTEITDASPGRNVYTVEKMTHTVPAHGISWPSF